jgi:hypothetical protein
MRLELLQLVEARVEEASRPLREEVATLKLLLAHVGDSLESSKACTSSGMGIAPAQALLPPDSVEQKSSVVEKEHLYGCLSPHGSPCPSPHPGVLFASMGEGMDEILPPVLQSTLGIRELCGESYLVPSMVLPLESDSSEGLAVVMAPSSS